MKRMAWLMKQQEGFTLIELMVVVIIIGILVAIGVPVYLQTRNNAQKKSCKENHTIFDGAVKTFEEHMDRYPSNLAEMTPGGTYQALKKTLSCPATGTYEYDWQTEVGEDLPPSFTCTTADHNP